MCWMSHWARRSTCASAGLSLAALLVLTGAAPAPAPQPAAPATPAEGGAFAAALDAVRRGDAVETARLCWAYLRGRERGQAEAGGVDKAESATFYLGEALEKLGYVHAAIDRYGEIVSERRAPQLVPRALAALERLSRRGPAEEEAIAASGVLSVTEFEELPP